MKGPPDEKSHLDEVKMYNEQVENVHISLKLLASM